MQAEHRRPPLPPLEVIRADVQRALTEDVGGGDLTAALVPASDRSAARVVSREAAVLCGVAWFNEVFSALDAQVIISWRVKDGDRIQADQTVCQLRGPTRALLTGERTALNFLQLLSGTATAAHRYAEAVAGTRARVLDTRKTLPGLRVAQKYAVACGGGSNHRMGLYDAILVKENHILAAGSIRAVIEACRRIYPNTPIEVEVESQAELEEALRAQVDTVLLDNFSPPALRQAVARTAGRAKLEASGGLTLGNLRAIAETGVDLLSDGAMTKDVRAVDLSLRFDDRSGPPG